MRFDAEQAAVGAMKAIMASGWDIDRAKELLVAHLLTAYRAGVLDGPASSAKPAPLVEQVNISDDALWAAMVKAADRAGMDHDGDG